MDSTNCDNHTDMNADEQAPPHCMENESLPDIANLQLEDNNLNYALVNTPTTDNNSGSLSEFISKVEEEISQNKNSDEIYKFITENCTYQGIELSEVVQLLHENGDYKKLIGAIIIRKSLSATQNPNCDSLIDSNWVPTLIEMSKQIENIKLKKEALWSITNIASQQHCYVEYLVNQSVIPVLFECLNFEEPEIVEHAVWWLGNIAGDDDAYKQQINQTGAISKLLQILLHSNVMSDLRRNCAWCISNLFRGALLPESEYVNMAIPVLIEVLKQEDWSTIWTDILWNFNYITEKDYSTFPRIFECDGAQIFIKAFRSSEKTIFIPAVRIIGNLTWGEDLHIEYLVNWGVLNDFKNVLSSQPSEYIQKEWYWALSNFCASSQIWTTEILNLGLDLQFMQAVLHGSEKIKTEAIWCLCNLTPNLTKEMAEHLIKNNIIQVLIEFLKSNTVARSTLVALEGLGKILDFNKELQGDNKDKIIDMVEQCGGIDVIELLQTHPNQNVYSKALSILEKHFNIDDMINPDQQV